MNDLVYLNDRTPTTTSLKIAEVFGKRHCDVLRSIKQLWMPEDFRLRNFALSTYSNEQDHNQPMYEITKDGFVLLAMGFTGKKAMEFKINYINAFNEMQNRLANTSILTAPDLSLVGGTVKRCVKTAMKEYVNGLNKTSPAEVTHAELMAVLFDWSRTLHKNDLKALEEENEDLKYKLSQIEELLRRN